LSSSAINTSSLANRRRARRSLVNGHTKVECLKGSFGRGPNVAIAAVDLSEAGVRLIVEAPLTPGEEIELQFSGPGTRKPIRRLGTIVWSVELSPGYYGVGVAFEKDLKYGDFYRLAKV
jgi:hypothetical protein